MSINESSDFPEDDRPLPDSSKKKSNSNSSKGPNKLMVFSGMAVQMGVVIGLGAWSGQLLDEKYKPEKPYWTIALSLLGVFMSLYLLIKQAKKLSDDS
jgi:F0F1-type ATP synthase assembly protein I